MRCHAIKRLLISFLSIKLTNIRSFGRGLILASFGSKDAGSPRATSIDGPVGTFGQCGRNQPKRSRAHGRGKLSSPARERYEKRKQRQLRLLRNWMHEDGLAWRTLLSSSEDRRVRKSSTEVQQAIEISDLKALLLESRRVRSQAVLHVVLKSGIPRWTGSKTLPSSFVDDRRVLKIVSSLTKELKTLLS